MRPHRRLQAYLVDAIKRRAIAHLHRSARGEALLLRVYLEAEECAEAPFLVLSPGAAAPAWLVRQLERHRRDEARHAGLLRARLTALGVSAATGGRFDAVARWKLDRLRTLADGGAARFRAGSAVSCLAVAWRMEEMGVRVLGRHVAALESMGLAGHPTASVLRKILRDERGHAAGCQRALDRLVEDGERLELHRLIAEIDAIDRALGVTSALALWAAGVVVALLPASGPRREVIEG